MILRYFIISSNPTGKEKAKKRTFYSLGFEVTDVVADKASNRREDR